MLLEKTYRRFVRGGANLEAAQKDRSEAGPSPPPPGAFEAHPPCRTRVARHNPRPRCRRGRRRWRPETRCSPRATTPQSATSARRSGPSRQSRATGIAPEETARAPSEPPARTPRHPWPRAVARREERPVRRHPDRSRSPPQTPGAERRRHRHRRPGSGRPHRMGSAMAAPYSEPPGDPHQRGRMGPGRIHHHRHRHGRPGVRGRALQPARHPGGEDLIYRHYDPQSGQVCLDGKDLRDYDLPAFRKFLAIVPQEVEIFDLSVRENIAYARPGASFKEIIINQNLTLKPSAV